MPPHLIFGAGGIGTTAKSFTFTWDTPAKVSSLLSLLTHLSINELDSAASYPPTNPFNAETLLGQAGAPSKGFIIDSKIVYHGPDQADYLTPASIASSTAKTLSLLGTDKVRIMYAHAPAKDTPLEETARGFHEQYVAGAFEELGLCSYSVEELGRYMAICEERGYVKPSVYQGCYNALYREAEDEGGLVEFLRAHGMRYYVFSPLAGGFLTGKVTEAVDSGDEEGLYRTRWRGESAFAGYVAGFDRPVMHEAVRRLRGACERAGGGGGGLTLTEVSLRWLMHHSRLEEGDGIIFGAKTEEQMEGNVEEARRGPLEGEVLEVVEGLWGMVSGGDKGEDGGGDKGAEKEGE